MNPLDPNFIGLPPLPTSIIVRAETKPDDDMAIEIGGIMVVNARRNAGDYTDPTWSHNDEPLIVGTWVQIYTFDGWAATFRHCAWTADIAYASGDTVTVRGGLGASASGSSSRPLPDPLGTYYSDPPTFHDYFPNGAFRIPPPPSWRAAPSWEDSYTVQCSPGEASALHERLWARRRRVVQL